MGYKTYTKGNSVPVSANFTSAEFDCHGSRCCSQTKINDVLVNYLQKIRDHFQQPISVTSGYRCPIHNSSVNGATSSRHKSGDAADIVVKGVAPAEVAKYAERIGILGIGLYETSKDGFFVHIDTRTVKSFWYGQAQKYRSTFGGSGGTSTIIGGDTVNTGALDSILNRGDIGAAVKDLQEKLIMLGYSCGDKGADGVFGSKTESAVMEFQHKHGLSRDGIAGVQTLDSVNRAIAGLNAIGEIEVTANVLNVRSGVGMNYPIVSTVRKGTTCMLIEEKNGWGRLLSPAGWVSMQYVIKCN